MCETNAASAAAASFRRSTDSSSLWRLTKFSLALESTARRVSESKYQRTGPTDVHIRSSMGLAAMSTTVSWKAMLWTAACGQLPASTARPMASMMSSSVWACEAVIRPATWRAA